MKIIKIAFINLFFVIIVFFIIDIISYIVGAKEEQKILNTYNINIENIYRRFNTNILDKKYRPIENKTSKLKPILIFGCSYAYGYKLNNNETFSYYLGKLTHRPIYNRARGGWSPVQMIYQLQNNNFYNIVPKPEYIIYVFMTDQISRLYDYHLHFISKNSNPILYKVIKNKNVSSTNPQVDTDLLKRDYIKENLLRSNLFLLNQINKRIQRNYEPTQQNLNFLKYHFLQAYMEINKHWGKDVKFVIFSYTDSKEYTQYKTLFNELKNIYGIEVINIQELSNKDFFTNKYQISETDSHPNAKAWKEITPLLIKKLNIK